MKRVFLLVLDSLGIGAAPDAADFGDESADTMARISRSSRFLVPTLKKWGIGHIDGLSYLRGDGPLLAAGGRLTEQSRGKDTTIGHWELAGHLSDRPLPTYPPRRCWRRFAGRRGAACCATLPPPARR